MAGWVDRQIDRYVDKQLDGFLKGQMSDESFEQLESMTRKGRPLDKASTAGAER